MKMANDSYQKFLYGEAIPLYEEIIHKAPENMEAKKKLATCYRMSNDTRNSERLYSQLVVEDSVGLLNKLYYAQALAENGKYDQAKIWYKKYDNALAIDARGKRFLNSYNNFKKFYKDSSSWQIDFLAINSPQADFSPMYYKKGIVFCSARTQGGAVKYVYGWDQSAFLNLYYVEDTNSIIGKRYYTDVLKDNISSYYDSTGHVAKGHSEDAKSSGNDSEVLGYFGNTFLKEEEEWILQSKDLIVPFNKKINSKYHEGPSSFSKDLDSMVFTRNGFHGGKLRKSKDGVSKLKIYSSKHIGDTWTTAKPIKFNKFQYYVKFTGLNSFNRSTSESDTSYVKEIELDDDQFSISHPCLSRDNKKLFFVSDAPIGFGGSDVYVCNWEGSNWSSPVNCGKNINTEGNEMFPFADDNGNLYFSSDGWGGMGGLDIYFSETELNIFGEKDNIFNKPVNLGFPINSKKDDFGIIVNKEFTSGFFSSNRRKGANDDDIFRFRFIGPTTIAVTGMVVKRGSGTPMDSAKVVLRDLKSGLDSVITPKYGMFSFPELSPGKDYIVFIDRKGYHSQKINLNTMDLKRGDTCKVKVELEPKEIFIYVKGNVFGEDDKLPMPNVRIKIFNNCTGVTDEIFSDALGNYSMRLKENCCYAISAIKDNCGVNSTVVSTVGIDSNKDILTDFAMLCKGDVVKLDDIYYDLGKWDIRPEAAIQLDKLLVLMKKYPDMKIELRAHTDSRGDDAKNLVLSDKRAKSAEKYLESKGINVASISGKGYGESLPLNKCKNKVPCSDEEYQINRRSEFKILSMGKPMALATINAKMAGNCQNYVDNVIKKEEEANREPEYKPTPVSGDLLDAMNKKEINPNSIVDTDAKAKADAAAKAKLEADVKAKADADAKAKADAEARAKMDTDAKAKTDAAAKAKLEADAKAKADADAKAKADAEARAKMDTDAKAKADAAAKAKLEADAKAKADTDAKAKMEADVKAKADAAAKAKLEAEAKAKADVAAKAKLEAAAKAKADIEAKAKMDADAKAKADALAKAKTDADAKAKVDALAKAKTDADAKAKLEADATAKAKADADAKAKVDATAKAKNETPTEEDPFAEVFTKKETTATSAIKGTVLKGGTAENLNGAKLILKSNGKKIDSTTTVVGGGFMFTKLPASTNYEVYVSRKGYFDQKISVNSSALMPGQTGTIKVNLVLDPNQKDVAEPEMVFLLKGKVVNETNVAQSGVTVSLTNNMDKTTTEVKANQQGEYSFPLRKQCHYTVKATRANCKSLPFNKSTIGLQSSQTFELELVIRCE